MRIRKHANSLLFSSSSDSLLLKSRIICQLNQSPWDIITFPPPSDSSQPPPPPPPPPCQFDGNEISYINGNGSLAEYSLESVGSMKDEETDCKVEEEREEKRIRGANLCCKTTDGKQWQCKREAQKRHTLCDYHLAQIKNYNTLAHPSIAKSAASNKPTRARKATTISPSNPNEFYYYSGFGPRWGKKRDIAAGTSITQKKERESVGPIKTVPIPRYSSSEIDEEDEEKCGIGMKKKKKKKKKRRRKPIKARSLKDLCEVMG